MDKAITPSDGYTVAGGCGVSTHGKNPEALFVVKQYEGVQLYSF